MTNIKKRQKVVVSLFWSLYLLGLICIVSIFTLISTGNMGYMPTFEHLENPQNYISSEVISSDNETLGKYYYQNRSLIDFEDLSPNIVKALLAIEDIRFENHSGIDFRGLSRVLFKTLLLGQRDAGGGSTITQQLAKNLFNTRSDNIQNIDFLDGKASLVLIKLKEWVTAIRLERNYTKREILVMYLNTVFYGSQSYGIKAASQTFFNKEPHNLDIEEAALLAGVVNAPTRYNPVNNPKAAKKRRDMVLSQMKKYNFISNKVHDSLVKQPIKLKYRDQKQNQGLAPYFREYVRIQMTRQKPDKTLYYSYKDYQQDSLAWLNNPLTGWVYKNKKPDGTPYNLYKDGLRIHTTINSSLQTYAEQSMKKHLGEVLQREFFAEKKHRAHAPFSKELKLKQINSILDRAMKQSSRYNKYKKAGMSEDSIQYYFDQPVEMTIFTWEGEKDTTMSPYDSIKYYKHLLRVGMMAVDPENGHIKVYIGGPDFRYFKYDHVIKSKRQVGSTIKPFFYTLAMEEGYSPCQKAPCVQQTFQVNDTTWSPRTTNKKMIGEMVTLRWGLANSDNYISAWLLKQFNTSDIFSAKPFIQTMQRMGIKSKIFNSPSIILGSPEISLYEMVGAYSTFANKGIHIKPMFVTKIEDKTGTTIQEFQPHKQEAIGEKTAYKMLDLLQSVVNEGTAIGLRSRYQFESQLGGKTGTTQNNSDGWFMGVAPNIVGGVWVGGENRAIHFDHIAQGQGAHMAMPIFAEFLEKVYADSTLSISPNDTFEKPDNIYIEKDCRKAGKEYEPSEFNDTDDDYLNTNY